MTTPDRRDEENRRRLENEQGAADAVDRNASDPAWVAAWETEDNYWTENFSSRPYTIGSDYYEQFRPAYRYGVESATRNAGRRWDDVEPELKSGWESYEHRGDSQSTWDDIKDAVRDAWDRIKGDRPKTESRGL